jgi:hypothetical protein
MNRDDPILKMAHAIMVNTNCGCTSPNGERVLCCDPSLSPFDEQEKNCTCIDAAREALKVLLEAFPELSEVLFDNSYGNKS